MKKTCLLIMGISLLAVACNTKHSGLDYIETFKGEVVDDYFGIKVADPYRWLEDDTSKEVAKWVEKQNAITEKYLSAIPFRKKLQEKLTDIVNYEKIGIPFVKNGKYYFFKNDGLQNQSVLYVRNSFDGDAEVLLDPNALSDDGTVALKKLDFSNDGKYMSYVISRNGSDWEEIYVLDLKTKTLIKDEIKWAKFSSVSWCGNGFYYSAYDAPTAKGTEYSEVNENHKIYYHKIGTEQKNDELYFENKKHSKSFYHAFVPEEENVIFIYESGTNNGNKLFVDANLYANSKKTPIIEIASDNNYEYNVVDVIGSFFYVLTNYKAPKYRLMLGDIRMPEIENWIDIIPESENVLAGVDFTADKIIVKYEQDAANHAFVYSLNGKKECEIALPTFGSVSFSTSKKTNEVFYSFTSFTFPTTIYKYDIKTNKSEVYIKPNLNFKPENFETKQVFYTSKDGTQIPMFIVYKKGLERSGNNPTLIYGYGGFNVSLNPSFSAMRIPFIENGGVYAVANLRGGGEYGEEWHLAGTKMQKQNVFDDFIAAAEFLISEKYTSKEKLGILGGSNGGLLVGTVTNQRPDLFRVAIPEVGVMDMLRYHLFTIGWNWASDYGKSDDSKEMFEYLKAYSPLHNIKNDGTPHPAILITTADHDDRVVPAHSFKYAAQLQASNTGDAPKIIRIDTKAGHGSGKPIAKIIEEQTDIYAFIMFNLKMKFQ